VTFHDCRLDGSHPQRLPAHYRSLPLLCRSTRSLRPGPAHSGGREERRRRRPSQTFYATGRLLDCTVPAAQPTLIPATPQSVRRTPPCAKANPPVIPDPDGPRECVAGATGQPAPSAVPSTATAPRLPPPATRGRDPVAQPCCLPLRRLFPPPAVAPVNSRKRAAAVLLPNTSTLTRGQAYCNACGACRARARFGTGHRRAWWCKSSAQ